MIENTSSSSSSAWTSVTNLQIDPANDQSVLGNGYHMVQVNVFFTPIDNTGAAVTVPQEKLNASVRLIYYDTGAEVPFLKAPPTPDDPITSDEFESFTSWAHTQTPNQFLTEGADVSFDVSLSCVTFYVMCNAINPNPPSLKLGVKIQPTNGELLLFYLNGQSGLGSNGAKTIMYRSPRQYKLEDLSITGNNIRHTGGYDDFGPGIYTYENLWRQYNFTISLPADYMGAIISRSDYPPTEINDHRVYYPPALESRIGGYRTRINIWPDSVNGGQYCVFTSLSQHIYITIPDASTGKRGWSKFVRVSAVFMASFPRSSFQNISIIPVTIWDEKGNYIKVFLNTDIQTYTQIDSGYTQNKNPWIPVVSTEQNISNIEYKPFIIVNGKYGTLAAESLANNANIYTMNNMNIVSSSLNMWGFNYGLFPLDGLAITLGYYALLNQAYQLFEGSDYQESIDGYNISIFYDAADHYLQMNWYMHPAWSKNGFFIRNAYTSNYLAVTTSCAVYAGKHCDPQDSAYLWYLLDNPAPNYPGWGS
ncbi:hypothetical protein [Brucella sp. 2716]|uniref:hypothetical protein n=1 Tax=Brucella sp. 2716 TaxID=2975052 RepID=UPI00217D79A0|nr:hypothetical protein [Brucella sp. 2716]UWF59421.1 hypothetical protein NYO66_02530 [Brucella sp. 2716]